MARTLSFAFCFILSLHGVAQTYSVHGKVIDAVSMEPLPYASIFINGTTVGVNADESGKFILHGVPEGEVELVCSYAGYETYQIKSAQLSRDEIIVKLKPAELKEIEITGKTDDKWKSQLRRFEQLFLGPGKSNCKIQNSWVLEFQELDGNVLIAKASAPLEIENLGLGYTVRYMLKEFIVTPSAYNIVGITYFKEIATYDPKLIARWRENRIKAYRSSIRHLFRAIVNGNVRQEGFELYEEKNPGDIISRNESFAANLNSTLAPYEYAKAVIPGAPGKFLVQLPSRLEVHYLYGNRSMQLYKDIPHAVGWIVPNRSSLMVNANGLVLNPSAMLVSGYFTQPRVAQMLPNDFDPSSVLATKPPSVRSSKPSPQLAERPYVHTDKPYYYPGEIIWMKVYMNYASPWKRDSLSAVVYVDLMLGASLVERKTLPLDNGMAEGTVKIPSTTGAGDYHIRAFTTWMQNYDDRNIFIKPIKLLSRDETVQAPADFKTVSKSVIIEANKSEHILGEKIILTLATVDSLERPVEASLSVSITDMEQAIPVKDEKTILSSFNHLLPEAKDSQQKFPIEYGLNFSGQYTNARGEGELASLTVADEKLSGVFTVNTSSKGEFILSSLHFYDSLKLAVGGKGTSKKKGRITLQRMEPVIETATPEPLAVRITKRQSLYPVTYHDEDTLARLLPEVVIESQKEPRSASIHGTPDASVTGEWLKSTHATNILMALQSRVPGFVVYSFVGYDGMINYRIRFNTPTSFMDSLATPLVLINDTPLSLEPNELTQYLQSINPADVDRIEVLKYGKGAAYGLRGGNGVIAIYLKIGVDDVPEGSPSFKPKDFEIFNIAGYSSPLKFKPAENVVDDAATTIYWNPQVNTDVSGNAIIEFYGKNTPARYRIVVEGVTVTGEPVRGEKIVESK